MALSVPAPNKSTLFYGWKLTWLACFANVCLQGSGIYLMNALIEPLQEMYGWSRGELGNVMAFGSFVGIGSMPVFASLALKVPLRLLMTAGAAVGGFSIIMLGRCDNLAMFTMFFVLVWLSGQACGGTIANALISNWFAAKKGHAFGIANSGTSFSGAVLPLLVLVLMGILSMKQTTLLVGGVVLFLLAPLCFLMVRDTPAQCGLNVDGDTNLVECNHKKPYNIPIGTVLRSPAIWRLGFAFGMGLMLAAGVVSQLKPRFSDLGFSNFAAMGFMSLTAFCAALGKYGWGHLSDKLGVMRTIRILFLSNIFSLMLGLLPANVFTSLLFAVLGGFCLGGFWTMLPLSVVHLFKHELFMTVYRVISLFVLFKSLGYSVMGLSFECTGSYSPALIFFMVGVALGYLALYNIEKSVARFNPAASL